MQEGIASGAVRAFEAPIPQDAVLRIGAAPAQDVEHALRRVRADGILREESCYAAHGFRKADGSMTSNPGSATSAVVDRARATAESWLQARSAQRVGAQQCPWR